MLQKAGNRKASVFPLPNKDDELNPALIIFDQLFASTIETIPACCRNSNHILGGDRHFGHESLSVNPRCTLRCRASGQVNA